MNESYLYSNFKLKQLFNFLLAAPVPRMGAFVFLSTANFPFGNYLLTFQFLVAPH